MPREPLPPKDVASTTFSAIALLVSFGTFLANYRLAQDNAVLGRKPVLVFQYSDERGWVLRNIGAGPALNVLVAQKRETGPWFDPVRAPALTKDGEFALSWLGHTNTRALGVSYSDFQLVNYTSVSEADVSQVHDGTPLGSWNKGEIKPFWTRGDDVR